MEMYERTSFHRTCRGTDRRKGRQTDRLHLNHRATPRLHCAFQLRSKGAASSKNKGGLWQCKPCRAAHARIILESPSYYVSGYPQALRDAYLKKWHEEHDPKPGKEPIKEGFSYRGAPWDEEKPHLWRFFQGARNHQEVTEDIVVGHNAALACHMANESCFRKAAVTWDAVSNQIKS